MPKPIEASQVKIASGEVWAAYNTKMVELFRERNQYTVDTPERVSAARAILALWVAQEFIEHALRSSDARAPDNGNAAA